MIDQTNRPALPVRDVSGRVPLIFMVSLAAALLLLGRAETYVVDRARQVVTDLAAPLLELASRPVAAARRVVESTDQYAYVFDENERLRVENADLLEWKERAIQLEAKLARFEALLNVQVDPAISYVTGRVVGDSGGPFVETFIVNVGETHGVESGQAVIDTQGLLGRIVATGPDASRILLLTDLNSRVPVVIESTQVRAILSGDNSSTPRLDFLPPGSAIRAGDRVVTSGHGGLLPPGLPVGLVVDGGEGLYTVRTYSDRTKLDMVRVLQYVFPTEVDTQDPPPIFADGVKADAGSGAPAPAPSTGAAATPQSGGGT
ncbi:MAG: rod shape-determining protein MreC [Rhodobiaceae bacterium]|nr:rod shape-determining protein MreC [Rhodobiaceae bacterium]